MPRPRHVERRQKEMRPPRPNLPQFVTMKALNQQRILGLIRHALTFGGGFLVASGKIDESSLTEGIAAAITLIGIVWSALAPEKKPS